MVRSVGSGWSGPPEGQAPRLGTRDAWLILQRRRWLVLAILALAVLGSALTMAMTERRYVTHSTIVLKPVDVGLDQSSRVPVATGVLSRSIIETQLDVLRSRAFAGDVAKTLDLVDNPDFAPPADPGSGTPADAALRQQAAVDKLLSLYTVSRSGESLAINIVVTATDPKLAAAIANTVAKTYISDSMEERRADLQHSIDFMVRRVDSLAEDLANSEVKLVSFISDNNLNDQTLPTRLRLEVDHLSRLLNDTLSDTPNSPQALRVKARLAEVKSGLAQRTRAEITQVRMQKSMEYVRGQYETAVDALSQLQERLRFIQAGPLQVTIAQVPASPVWPNPPVTIAAAGGIGLALAFIAAFMAEGFDRRLWNEEGVDALTGVPNAGFVPQIGKLARKGTVRDMVERLQSAPGSALARSLRGIVTPWVAEGGKGRIVMVTSGLPGEGKSTVTRALAAAAALDGLRVLVLLHDGHGDPAPGDADPDARAATITDLAAWKRVLPSRRSLREPGDGVEVVRLDGRATAGPRQQQQSVFDEIRSKLGTSYDMVLVDAPAVLVDDDARRLSPIADDILLVVRWGQTTEDVLGDTLEQLDTLGVAISATVINDVDFRRHRKMGYGGRAQYFAHGTVHG